MELFYNWSQVGESLLYLVQSYFRNIVWSFWAKRLLLISRCLKGVENKGRINPTGGIWDLVTYLYKWAGRRFCNPPSLSASRFVARDTRPMFSDARPWVQDRVQETFSLSKALPCQNNMTGAVVAPSTILIPSKKTIHKKTMLHQIMLSCVTLLMH